MLKSDLLWLRAHVVRVVLFAFLSACVTPVDIEVDTAGNTVVIAGQVSNLEGQTYVQVGLTAGADQATKAVTGVEPWLVDETADESTVLYESPTTPGLYKPRFYEGIPGHAYHVQVQFPNRGNYVSETDIMPPLPGIVKARYEFKQEQFIDQEGVASDQRFLLGYVDAKLPAGDPLFLRWSVEEVYLLSPTDIPDPWGNIPTPCYIEQNAGPQDIVLFDGHKINTRNIENLAVVSREIDWTFLEKHAFTVFQSSISAATHDYWAKVELLANSSGSIFDTPPAALNGNVHRENSDERSFGYFFATAQTIDRFFVYRTDLPFPLLVEDCVYADNRSSYPTRCLDCLTVRYSTNSRPDWF